MGRPPEVSDEDIIAAGKELAQRRAVTATGIWLSCGKRGRPGRLFAVWNDFATQAAANKGQAGPETLLIPDEARSEGTKLKASLSQGIDQAIGCIYQGIERAFTARYQQEVEALQRMRGATVNEVTEALAALGDASEESATLQATVECQKDQIRAMEISLCALKEDFEAARDEVGEQTTTYMELKLAYLNNESLLEAAKAEVTRALADRCAAEDRAIQARESLLICQMQADGRLSDITRLTAERDQAVGKNEAYLARTIRAEHALERSTGTAVKSPPPSDEAVAARRSPKVRSPRRTDHEVPDQPSAMAPALGHVPVADTVSAGGSVRP